MPESPKSCAPPLDSATATTTTATSPRTPSIGTDNISDNETKSKMNINSLLDAAAVIENSPKRKLNAQDTLPSKKVCVNLEDRSCDTWDVVENIFVDHVAVFLDSLVGTTRFSQMPILDKARTSGLPLDGNGSVTIPGSVNTSRKNDTTDANYNTIRVGQNIATLEAIRQMLTILCPNFYLDNLSIDEGSVSKLEELRTSTDYKLLRAVVQLISSPKDTEFLPIGDKDRDLMHRIQALHKFITVAGDPNQPKATVVEKPEVQDTANIAAIFQNGLTQATCFELWQILGLIASNQQELPPDQEDVFLEFAGNCASQHAMRVPLLLGAHYYLLTRRPQKQIKTGRDSNLRLLLLESCSMGGNVVSRRLVNMIMN